MDGLFHRFTHRLEQQGVEFGQYLELTGQDQTAFVADLRSQADLNIRTRVMIESVAVAEEIVVEDSELDETVVRLAAASEMEVGDYKKALVEGGQENALSGDILRRKAVDRLLELAVPVDGSGNEIDLSPDEDTEDGESDDTDPASKAGADGKGASDGSGGTDDSDVTSGVAPESNEAETEQNRLTDGGQQPAEVEE